MSCVADLQAVFQSSRRSNSLIDHSQVHACFRGRGLQGYKRDSHAVVLQVYVLRLSAHRCVRQPIAKQGHQCCTAWCIPSVRMSTGEGCTAAEVLAFSLNDKGARGARRNPSLAALPCSNDGLSWPWKPVTELSSETNTQASDHLILQDGSSSLQVYRGLDMPPRDRTCCR